MSALRRKLAAAVAPFADDAEVTAITEAVMGVLTGEPLMLVLSGLTEEVIDSRGRWEGNNYIRD